MVISPNYFMFLTGLRNDPSNTIEKFYRNNLDGVETFVFKIQEEIDLSDIIKNDNCHKKYRLDGLISYNFYEHLYQILQDKLNYQYFQVLINLIHLYYIH